MNKYQKEKEKTRNEAIEWQADFANHNYNYSYGALFYSLDYFGTMLYFLDYFEKKARRYGLVKEFRERGII